MDEASAKEYSLALTSLHVEDFNNAMIDVVHSSKFFPSIAEIMEAAKFCRGRRLAFEDSQERKRIEAGEKRIMDPKDPMHRQPVGPNHARFLRLLRGEEKFPEPEWMKKRKVVSLG